MHRFKKELIRKGKFVKESDGIEFEVTDETLDHWSREFARMKSAGVRVPVPIKHLSPKLENGVETYDADDPASNGGWLQDVVRDGDSLYGVIDLIDPQLALTSDVSIFTPPKLVDGKGNTYVRPISHVALCTNPVIPGLGDFIPLAASRTTSKETKMDYTKIAEALEVLGEINDGNAEEVILAGITKMKNELNELKGLPPEEEPVATDPDGQPIEAAEEEEEEEEEEEPVAASRGHRAASRGHRVDPLLVKLASENRSAKLDALVSAGRITPAVREKLAKQFIGKDNSVIRLSLSMGDDGSHFDAICSALAANDPVALVGKTGPQVPKAVRLSREQMTDPKHNPLIADAENRRIEAEKRLAARRR